jgi:hypothetical protein
MKGPRCCDTFCLGMLAGVALMASVWMSVDLYWDMNTRVQRVEGYLSGLNMMMRSHQ